MIRIFSIIFFLFWNFSFGANSCEEPYLVKFDKNNLNEIVGDSKFRESLLKMQTVSIISLDISDLEAIFSVIQNNEFGEIFCLKEYDHNLVKIRTELSPSNGREMFMLRSEFKHWIILDETLRDWYLIRRQGSEKGEATKGPRDRK
ncbi:hypothetical protein [Puniceicoccus vermicola]|uniref:Uncharacterized protein n=1 Tax=Puniceicoccus vermicola TaxID=388746 RepID=A0A7X1B0L2_9BACT|nr:hypothetical protein [Puniceicoccus vermicola]MBC2603264.1 hypothetical protein [Puniceicoccus vermicola]